MPLTLDHRRILAVIVFVALVTLAIIVVNFAVMTGHTSTAHHILASSPDVQIGWH